MSEELGQVIGERTLRCSGLTSRKRITVRLGTPRPAKDVDWLCPYEIDGLGGARVEVAHGLDAMQALMMALEAIRVRLEQDGLQCTWQGGEEGDAGFPRVVPTFFGPAFTATIHRLIDREVERFSKVVEKKSKRSHRAASSAPSKTVRGRARTR
jgi:hypothetical protein